MDSTHIHIKQLEAENRKLKAQLGRLREITKQNEYVLTAEKERLQALGDNFPKGTLFRFKMDMATQTMSLDYVSATWEKILGLSAEKTKADISTVFSRIDPDDLSQLMAVIDESARTMCNVDIELRYRHPDNSLKWMHLASHPHRENDTVYSDGFVLDITDRKHIEQALIFEKERLQALGDHFPNGTLFRFQLKASVLLFPNASAIWLRHLQLSYASATWEKISNVPLADAMQNAALPFLKIHPDDLAMIIPIMYECLCGLSTFNVEVRYIYADDDMRWLQVSAHPRIEDEWVVCDGFILDITNRKHIESELARYREELELLVKDRTEELEATNEELAAINEELGAANEELAITNNELDLYRTQLEQMVELKTRQQSVLIKVLQIVQSSKSIPKALNVVLAEIGSYTGVSRAYIFEKDAKGNTINNTYEWCNEDIDPMLEFSQQIPTNGWYDTFDRGEYICTSDTETLPPVVAELLAKRGCLSLLAIPLIANGVHYGFVGLDECSSNKGWEKSEIDLLTSLSQIITNTMRRHRAETAMRLSQQTMRTVFNNINASIFVSDFETSEILFANKKIKEIVGEIEGRMCWEVMQKGMTGPCEFCPRVHLRDHNNRPTGLYHWEHRNTNTHNWYECTDSAIEWVDGRLVHMEYATNITRRKKAEMELIHAKEKAEESDKLKSAFLANMSHEIRTPLNGIAGFLNFLDDDSLVPLRRHEYIGIVNNSAGQLMKLIDDIVDVAKIEAGQMNVCPVSFRLNELMEEMYVFFETWLYSNNKTHTALVLDRSGFIDHCMCFIDSMRLRQVLVNLIGNAVKFTDKGYIRFGYRQTNSGMLEFIVEDTGVGIPESQQKLIFERFRQAEQNTTKHYGGTGLGLTISRSLSQMMGGDMRVESTEGIGATFYFTIAYLPIAPADKPIFELAHEIGSVTDSPFAGKTVLLAEPLDMKYAYYEKLLSAAGFTTIRADLGQQWLDPIALNRQTDVVVATLSAVGCNTASQSKTPIIYIVPEQQDDNSQLTCDPCVVLVEPVDYVTLMGKLGEVLGEKQ